MGKVSQLQSLPLSEKVNASIRRIRHWIDFWNGDTCVAYSGGFKSRILLSLIKRVNSSVPVITLSNEISCFKNQGDKCVHPKLRHPMIGSLFPDYCDCKSIGLEKTYPIFFWTPNDLNQFQLINSF